MKFKLSVSILLMGSIFPSSVNAQAVKEVKNRINHGAYYTQDTFYVLKSNPDIKHGEYSSTLLYSSVKGQYENGKKTGIWSYYLRNNLKQEYDFDRNELLLYPESKIIRKAWLVDENGTVSKETDLRPVFLGGDGKIIDILLKTIKHPDPIKKRPIAGINILSVTITKEGKMINPKIESKVGYGTDEEFLRIFMLLPNDWIPASLDEKPIDTRIEVAFSLTAS